MGWLVAIAASISFAIDVWLFFDVFFNTSSPKAARLKRSFVVALVSSACFLGLICSGAASIEQVMGTEILQVVLLVSVTALLIIILIIYLLLCAESLDAKREGRRMNKGIGDEGVGN